MAELTDRLGEFTVVELSELIRAASHTLDSKLAGLLDVVRIPVILGPASKRGADMGEIFDDLGGQNELSRIDRLSATGGFPVVRPTTGN